MPRAHRHRNRLLYRRFPQIESVGCRLYHDPSGRRTKNLADLVVCAAPMEEQPRLIAHIVEQLGRFVTEKRASAAIVVRHLFKEICFPFARYDRRLGYYMIRGLTAVTRL